MFYLSIKHAHSALRWLLLFLLLVSILISLKNLVTKSPYNPSVKKLFLSTVITSHIQFIIGIILYFVSPKVVFVAESMKSPAHRFFLVEHISLMIIAISFITIGYSTAKKLQSDTKKHKKILVYFLIAILIILIMIPWPFQKYGAAWI